MFFSIPFNYLIKDFSLILMSVLPELIFLQIKGSVTHVWLFPSALIVSLLQYLWHVCPC